MPSLIIFGRRWGIGSDDFVCPQLMEGSLRFFWFLIAFGLYEIHSDEFKKEQCKEMRYLRTYKLTLLLLNCLVIILCFCMVFISSRGTIRNGYARRNIKYFIYSRCPMFLLEIILIGCGSVLVWNTPELNEECNPNILTGAKMTVLLGWAMVSAILVGSYIVFDPLGSQEYSAKQSCSRANSMEKFLRQLSYQKRREHNMAIAKELWTRRLRCMCICSSADDHAKEALKEVADLFSDFFNDTDTDLVLTDVTAGLVMLSNCQLPIPNYRSIQPAVKPPEWMSLDHARRFILFAIGVYGWPYYVWNNRWIRPWLSLLCRTRWCTGCSDDKDLDCRLNTASFLLTTDISDNDLFYASYHDEVYQVPFIACADAVSKSIIVTIRGTMSLRDVVTDLCATDQCIDYDSHDHEIPFSGLRDSQPQNHQNHHSFHLHTGMLEAAKYVQSALNHHRILEDLFELHPEYNLVITGHSLGAGVAAILSLLLRPKYPKLRCFAFSPPGCVVSEDCVPVTEQFICSIVVGDDIVPRLSYQSMEKLKVDIKDAIKNCDLPKYKLLLKGCCRLFGPRPAQVGVESAQPTECMANGHAALDAVDGTIRTTLCTPGRIVHLNECGDGYAATWLNYRNFSDIKLSSRMVTDHFAQQVSDALQATDDF